MRRSLLLAASLALAVAANQVALPDERIEWKPCYNKGVQDPSIQCGRFEVPLDYADETVGKASLAVARYPATRQPKLGTLFLGPGGPGDSGIDSLVVSNNAKTIMEVVEGRYDLVSWDPRGSDFANSKRNVKQTSPRADCFSDAWEEYGFWNNTVPRWGLEARGVLPNDEDLTAFYDQVKPVDKLLAKLGELCLKKSQNKLKYMGTAATVRDVISLHDYLEGDKDINFWGFSYGTAIGIYLVNMFKERVGRVVLDGVVDPVYYANKPAHETWAIDAESSDLVLFKFLEKCSEAGSDKCAFATSGASDKPTAADLGRKINTMIINAYDHRFKMGDKATFGSAHIRDALFRGMYTPKRWRALARDLEACWKSFNGSSTPPEQGCYALIFNPSAQANSINWSKPPAYGLQAVTCADAVDAGGVETRDVFKMMVDVTNETSPLFGPCWGAAGFYCHKWPVRAVERYTGPWDNTLKNKIIVIGNEFDPITPFRSAESVAAALGDSAVLVQQKDYGHTSLAMHSNCTFNILHDYFLNGELPSSKQSCGTNQPIFEDEPEGTFARPVKLSPSLGKRAIDALLKPFKAPLAPVFTSSLLLVLFVLLRATSRAGKNKRTVAGVWKETLAKV